MFASFEIGAIFNSMKNTSKSLTKTKRITIPESISNHLRKQILIGEIHAGEPLRQELLAQQFGVSISALREALKILEGEKLVRFLPNHGAEVIRLTAEEALEIYEIRMMLETGILALSIPKLKEEDFLRAEKILEEEASCHDPARYNEINSLFHEYLYEPAGNLRLLDMIHLLHNNVARYLVFYLDKMDFKDFSHSEHTALLAACRERDVRKAKQVLKKHMNKACKLLVEYLKQHE